MAREFRLLGLIQLCKYMGSIVNMFTDLLFSSELMGKKATAKTGKIYIKSNSHSYPSFSLPVAFLTLTEQSTPVLSCLDLESHSLYFDCFKAVHVDSSVKKRKKKLDQYVWSQSSGRNIGVFSHYEHFPIFSEEHQLTSNPLSTDRWH